VFWKVTKATKIGASGNLDKALVPWTIPLCYALFDKKVKGLPRPFFGGIKGLSMEPLALHTIYAARSRLVRKKLANTNSSHVPYVRTAHCEKGKQAQVPRDFAQELCTFQIWKPEL